jgi:Spy/CpxP family protein refolding chaperone
MSSKRHLFFRSSQARYEWIAGREQRTTGRKRRVMKRIQRVHIGVIAAISLSLFGVSTLVYAQSWEWRGPHGHGQPGMYNRQIPTQYQITEQQKAKIDEVRQEYGGRTASVEAKMLDKRAALDAYLDREDIDPREIRVYHKDIRSLETELQDLRSAEAAAVENALSSSQREYFGDTFAPGWVARRWDGWNTWCTYSMDNWGRGCCW